MSRITRRENTEPGSPCVRRHSTDRMTPGITAILRERPVPAASRQQHTVSHPEIAFPVTRPAGLTLSLLDN
jgi:hypothetical protein